VTAHKVLPFASDHAFHGGGLARAMGSRFAPGAFLVSEPAGSRLNQHTYMKGQLLTMKLSMEFRYKITSNF
jgi:hypothetical protein